MRSKILMLTTILAISCENNPFGQIMGSEDTEIEPISIQLDTDLPLDSRGFYHMVVDENRWQTLKTINAIVYRGDDINNGVNIVKVGWASNLFWYYGSNDCYAKYTGEEYINNCMQDIDEEYLVPSTNGASYSREDGSVSNVIAPIRLMKSDTMILYTAWYDAWRSETVYGKPISIVLD